LQYEILESLKIFVKGKPPLTNILKASSGYLSKTIVSIKHFLEKPVT